MKSTQRLVDCCTLPVLGEWYVGRTCGRMLEVIYLDEEEGIVDVQDESGIFLEISLVNWYAAGFEVIEPPRNLYEELDEASIVGVLEAVRSHEDISKPLAAMADRASSVGIAA